MGGAKKKSMAQMEKVQTGQDEKPEPKKTKAKTVSERKVRGIEIPNINDSKFLNELSRIQAITPYAVASQFNLRLSIAKDLLEELEKKKLVRPVGGNARIRIYQAAAA